ncbi:MAG: hypothetical protein IH899_04990 [Planctomycetes bacterium]|nr:hypothetical protein [Planctomycetota bacterium]
MKGHTGDVNNVAFSPDGRRIVSGNRDETLTVWDALSGQPTAFQSALLLVSTKPRPMT